MKKLIVVLIITLLLVSFASAECTTVFLPKSTSMTLTSTSLQLTGDMPVILNEDHKFPGIKNLKEVGIILPYNSFEGYTYVNGIVNNEVIREVGLQVVYECGQGFSWLHNVMIEINNDYIEDVKAIVFERTGEEELSINSIGAAMLYRVNNAAGYIFYTSYSYRVRIGRIITVWGWVPIYKGDINEDGYYEIGLPPGINVVNTNTNTTVVVDTNTVVIDNTVNGTTTNVINTTTGCGSTVTNVNVDGNSNITTTTAATTIVKGDNNNTTVVNNNSNTNMYALIGIVINNDSNNTVVNTNSGEQEICRPSLFIDKVQQNPNSGCG